MAATRPISAVRALVEDIPELENAEQWLEEACEEGSAALLNRISQALSQLAALDPNGETAKWAADREALLVGPALKAAMEAASPDDD